MRVQKDKLLEFIQKHEQVTFCDIERFFDSCGMNYKGDTGIGLRQSKLVVWNVWNRKASRAFMELVAEGKIHMVRTGWYTEPTRPPWLVCASYPLACRLGYGAFLMPRKNVEWWSLG